MDFGTSQPVVSVSSGLAQPYETGPAAVPLCARTLKTLVMVSIVFAAMAFFDCAGARALIVAEPTISGPLGPVHHVETGGFETGYYWLLARGLNEPEVDGGDWEPTSLPAGDYAVEAWQPLEAGYAYARYQVLHSGISTEVRLRQANFGATWVTLGSWEFNGTRAAVHATDAAGYLGEQLTWADMRWTRLAAMPANIETAGETTTVGEPTITGPEQFVVRFAGSGYGGSLLRAFAQGPAGPALNTATWSAPLPEGEYQVEVYVPSEHAEAETGFTVHAISGEVPVEIQEKAYNNAWVGLGRFRFGASGPSVTSSDATGVKEQEIAWSAVRFVRVSTASAVNNLTPAVSLQPEGGTPSPTPQAHVPQPAPGSLVPAQPGLLGLRFFRVTSSAAGRRGREDGYAISSLFPSGQGIAFHYRCLPCLFTKGSQRPGPGRSASRITSSRGGGLLRIILKRKFYKGTRIAIEASALGYLPRRFVYLFPGDTKVIGPVNCAAQRLQECRS